MGDDETTDGRMAGPVQPVRITRRARAAGAAAAFLRVYPDLGRCHFGDARAIYAGLVALGPDPDPDAVDRVIGARMWTRVPHCSACGDDREIEAVTQVGEVPGYESSTAYLCDDCLRAACRAAGIALAWEAP